METAGLTKWIVDLWNSGTVTTDLWLVNVVLVVIPWAIIIDFADSISNQIGVSADLQMKLTTEDSKATWFSFSAITPNTPRQMKKIARTNIVATFNSDCFLVHETTLLSVCPSIRIRRIKTPSIEKWNFWFRYKTKWQSNDLNRVSYKSYAWDLLWARQIV